MQDRIRIGNVRLSGRTILAATCGVLNLPMRLAFKRLGAALTYVGAIDAAAVAEGPAGRLINILGREETTDEEERPVSIQLIGSAPEVMAEAAARVEPLADIIDLNFSGALRAVLEKGLGAMLLKDPDRIGEIVRAVAGRVKVPVTAKIRTGVEGNDVDLVRIAEICQSAGAAAITVHARSASQGYTGEVSWEPIGRVKQAVGIPVIGNGAVYTAADAEAMVTQTGCDFVMICTGAFINPLIFRQADAALGVGPAPGHGNFAGLVQFMREYFRLVRRVESRSRRRAFKKCCRQFLALRSYMKKLKAGKVKFG